MKKTIYIICIFIMVLIVLSGCSKQHCEYCDSANVKYKALFVPSGTSEYLSEECYQKRNENPTFDDFWVINPA